MIRYSKGHRSKGEIIYVKNIIGMQNYFNVIVAGYWSFEKPDECLLEDVTKNTTLVCRLSTPLIEIGKVMMENQQQKLQDNCKFFIETCNPALCVACKRHTTQSPDVIPNNWCILKTKLYNGEKIEHYYRKYMEGIFNNMIFSGILHLTISSRYTFGDNSLKIGGICRDMILFKESAIEPLETLDVFLPSMEYMNPTPSIMPPSNRLIIEAIPDEEK
ncbi:hypothetical protein AVEN_56601-1 [Araneus ventricosus]|uniref:Uncharacterized protein n=1 Tax=Araneus ventricosus TaxID=182803 RepID=A0A4Y2M8M8_ARAVE|nr:hypothetical protein AVEN_56601-1 [Araneus ventricosus]